MSKDIEYLSGMKTLLTEIDHYPDSDKITSLTLISELIDHSHKQGLLDDTLYQEADKLVKEKLQEIH